jgi:hypothetical protein
MRIVNAVSVCCSLEWAVSSAFCTVQKEFLLALRLCPWINCRCVSCVADRVQCRGLQALKLGVTTSGIEFEFTCTCFTMCSNDVFSIELHECVCRVDDYWFGYKLYCYAYAHSFQHETEFRQSKLGWWMVPPSLLH